jgi:hypothetical protein
MIVGKFVSTIMKGYKKIYSPTSYWGVHEGQTHRQDPPEEQHNLIQPLLV